MTLIKITSKITDFDLLTVKNGLQSSIYKMIEGDLNHQTQVGWIKWKKTSKILCDTQVHLIAEGKTLSDKRLGG